MHVHRGVDRHIHITWLSCILGARARFTVDIRRATNAQHCLVGRLSRARLSPSLGAKARLPSQHDPKDLPTEQRPTKEAKAQLVTQKATKGTKAQMVTRQHSLKGNCALTRPSYLHPSRRGPRLRSQQSLAQSTRRSGRRT
jgi:hypothetical protein